MRTIDECLRDLASLKVLPGVSPQELLANQKLANYTSVFKEMTKSGCYVEMHCYDPEDFSEQWCFRYHYDKRNFLVRKEQVFKERTSVIWDRQIALMAIFDEINNIETSNIVDTEKMVLQH